MTATVTMTPAEKLRAAAERMEALDKAATQGPWATEPAGDLGDYNVFQPGGDGSVSEVYDSADADLIATLRPLAPVIVTLLGDAADLLQREVRTLDMSSRGIWLVHRICDDTLLINGAHPSGLRCTCFDDALALADAILQEAS